jgi:hypothetical protein
MDDREVIIIENHMDNQRVERNPRVGIEAIDRMAYLLDDLLRIPIINKRIGLDPLLGLIPWAGDAITTLLGMYIVGNAVYYRLPKLVLLRMGLNIVVDALVGMLPFVGDVSDFFVKSNRRNLNLLRQYADERRQPSLSDYLFVGFVLLLILAVIIAFIVLLGTTLFASFSFLRNVSLF